MAIASPPNPIFSVADVLERLGHIPPERIRVHPEPGSAREEDAIEVNESKTGRVELIDGILVEKAMSFYESVIGMIIGQAIGEYLDEHPIGTVAGEQGMLRLALGQIRIPDISFVAWSSLPGGVSPDEPVLVQAPDLAVEVLSPSNTKAELERKIRDYFGAGVRAVWILDPPTKTMTVYSAPSEMQIVGIEGMVDGGEVLPGFQLSMTELFEKAKRRSKTSE